MADVNGTTYFGVSKFVTADVRLRYRFDSHWSAAAGVGHHHTYRSGWKGLCERRCGDARAHGDQRHRTA